MTANGTFEKSEGPLDCGSYAPINRRSGEKLLLSSTFQTFKDGPEKGDS